MRYLSVCSGIEAATVAWHPLGWTPVGFSEIEKFPSAVLAHHYPDTTNLGDMTQHERWPIGPGSVDLLVGGTPCQSFSVAGLRKGLADPRGNLALIYLAIADRLRPKWIVWENVPGVLSSSGGRDFGSFLGALGELGYGFAYRVLDAQWFGVAQRRRRVFLVGHASDWRRAAAVLFERESLRGHPAPSRAKGQGAAVFTPGSIGGYREGCGTLRANGGDLGGGSEGLVAHHVIGALTARGPDGMGAAQVDAQHYIPTWRDVSDCGDNAAHAAVAFSSNMSVPDCQTNGTTPTVKCGGSDGGNPPAVAIGFNPDQSAKTRSMGEREQQAPTLRAGAEAAVAIGTDCYNGQLTGDIAATMGTPGSSVNASGPTVMQAVSTAVAVPIQDGRDIDKRQNGIGVGQSGDPAYTLNQTESQAVATAMAVRRLTPVECERLQGFPDGYTAIPWRGKPASECPDGPRYRALGNSMAVPVMRWIGERIAAQEVAQ